MTACECRCPCHRPDVIATELRREMVDRAELLAEERTGLTQEVRARIHDDLSQRLEEARTGRYRTVSERRAAASSRVVTELFGVGR